MTAQIHDTVIYNGEEYDLIASRRWLGFSPYKYKIRCKEISSACWHGFYCTYKIINNRIYLDKLTIRTEDGIYPDINGIKAVPDSDELSNYGSNEIYNGPYRYENLKLEVTGIGVGRVLLGKNFLSDHCIFMGFQRGWAYETLIELGVDCGFVWAEIDHSDKAKAKREEIEEDIERFYTNLESDIDTFVEESFSLDYEDKVWWDWGMKPKEDD